MSRKHRKERERKKKTQKRERRERGVKREEETRGKVRQIEEQWTREKERMSTATYCRPFRIGTDLPPTAAGRRMVPAVRFCEEKFRGRRRTECDWFGLIAFYYLRRNSKIRRNTKLEASVQKERYIKYPRSWFYIISNRQKLSYIFSYYIYILYIKKYKKVVKKEI